MPTRIKGPLGNNQMHRYREFADQYILDFDPASAYRRCSWTRTKTRGSDHAGGSHLLGTPEVQEMVREAMLLRRQRLHMDQDTVLLEQARIALSDIRNYLEWDDDGVRFRSSAILDENASRAIESFEITEREMPNGTKSRKARLKLHNKGTALESLSKHLGLYTEKHEVEVKYGTIKVPALAEPKDWMDVIRSEIKHVNGNGNGTTKAEVGSE